MRIVAIQIAAGLSSRMKGPNKLLQEVEEGKSLVVHTFEGLMNSTIDDVILVTGRDSELVSKELKSFKRHVKGYTEVFNPHFDMGMTTSIQTGLQKAREAAAVMICLSDMPLLNHIDYNRLLDLFKKANNTKAVLAPFSEGRKGNPVIFGSAYFNAIANHQEMDGCASIVKANQEDLIRFETTSEAYFFDIDTPEALADYRTRVK